MASIFKFLILALIAALAGAGVTILLHWGIAPSEVSAPDMSYADFLSITLTALALMITILGFFVAAAGVIGWTTLENKLRSHSIEYFKDQLKEDAKLRRDFELLIIKVAHSGIENYKAKNGINENPSTEEDEDYND